MAATHDEHADAAPAEDEVINPEALSPDAPKAEVEDEEHRSGVHESNYTQPIYHNDRKVNIIVDSCADFDPLVAHALDVTIIGFPYVVDGKEYIDDLWESLSAHDFYEAMRKGADVSTSAVTPGRYLEIFEEAAKKGVPTVYLGFTAGLSSSIHSAEEAAQLLKQDYPDFELYIVDNKCPSAAAELLAIEAVHQADLGASAKDLVAWAKEARYYIQGYFTLDNFDALAKGGRIPPQAAAIGGKLDIKPELSYDTMGALSLKRMCRGRKKAIRAMMDDFRDQFTGEYNLPIAIVSADAEKDADFLEGLVRHEPGCEDIAVVRSSISPVIGSHVGPGMVALIFWGKDRREKTSLADRIARKVGGKQGQGAKSSPIGQDASASA